MIAQWRCSPTKQQQEKSFKNKIVLKEEANYFYDYELCEKNHIPVYTMYIVQFVFSFRFNFFNFFKLKTLIYIFPHRHFYLFMYK